MQELKDIRKWIIKNANKEFGFRRKKPLKGLSSANIVKYFLENNPKYLQQKEDRTKIALEVYAKEAKNNIRNLITKEKILTTEKIKVVLNDKEGEIEFKLPDNSTYTYLIKDVIGKKDREKLQDRQDLNTQAENYGFKPDINNFRQYRKDNDDKKKEIQNIKNKFNKMFIEGELSNLSREEFSNLLHDLLDDNKHKIQPEDIGNIDKIFENIKTFNDLVEETSQRKRVQSITMQDVYPDKIISLINEERPFIEEFLKQQQESNMQENPLKGSQTNDTILANPNEDLWKVLQQNMQEVKEGEKCNIPLKNYQMKNSKNKQL